MPFIVENIGTIVVAVILIAIVALIVWSMRKDKKNGKPVADAVVVADVAVVAMVDSKKYISL